MYKAINGWTKEAMKARIMERNIGKVSAVIHQEPDGYNRVSCLYRSEDGNACAAGCFLPDELYHPADEGVGINILMSKDCKIAAAMPLDPRAMVLLQKIHDNYASTQNDPRPALLQWIDENVKD